MSGCIGCEPVAGRRDSLAVSRGGPPTVTIGRDGADASGLAQGKNRSHVRGAVCTPSATGLQSNRLRVASSRQMGAHTCEQTRSNVPIVRHEWQTAPQPAMDITKLVFWMNRLGAGHTPRGKQRSLTQWGTPPLSPAIFPQFQSH